MKTINCMDCNLHFDDFGCMLILPNDLWKNLVGEENRDKLLCANCICKRMGDKACLLVIETREFIKSKKLQQISITTKQYRWGHPEGTKHD